MSPRIGRTGGSAARAFGKGTAVRGPRGIPSNGSFTNEAANTTSTAAITLNWSNADAAANVYLYIDSVFVSDLGVNRTFVSITQGANVCAINTSYLFEISAYKDGVESAKYNFGGAHTSAAYPSGYVDVTAGGEPPSTWNNSNNSVLCIGGGQGGGNNCAGYGYGGYSARRTNVTWNGAVNCTVGAGGASGGGDGGQSNLSTTPEVVAAGGYNNGQNSGTTVYSGGSGGTGITNERGGGGGGAAGLTGNGENGSDGTDEGIGYGGAGNYPGGSGGNGGDIGQNGNNASGYGSGGGGGGSGANGGTGRPGRVMVTWGA